MEYEESYRGVPIILTTTQVPAGGWSSEAVLVEAEQRVTVAGVSEVVYESVTTDTPKFRYTVSWGGDEIVGGRARMTDEEWVAIGATHDDDEYYRRFESAFGLSIAPTTGS